MKKLLLASFGALALSVAIAPAMIVRAQAEPSIPNWPIGATLTANTTLGTCAVAGCMNVPLDPTLSNCTVTAQSGSTFGSGTLTVYTSGDQTAADAQTVSGYADLGNPTSPASTITAVGALTFAVAAKTTLYVVLTGATSPSINVQVFCARGVARIAGGGGGGVGPSGPPGTAGPSGPPGPTGSPGPAGSPATTPTPFEQIVKNFCTANSVVGCHYYPMNETSGSTMFDAIGTLNGTYSDAVTDTAAFLPNWSMGLLSGERGIDMYYDSGTTDGWAEVTAIPTTAPNEYAEGIIVRNCDTKGAGTYFNQTNSSYFLGTNLHTVANSGLLFQQSQGELIGEIGSQGGITDTASQQTYASTCQPTLLVMAANPTSSYWMLNGVPNAVNASTPTPNSTIVVNGYITTGNALSHGGEGDVYAGLFIIPGNWNATQLQALQIGFDALAYSPGTPDALPWALARQR